MVRSFVPSFFSTLLRSLREQPELIGTLPVWNEQLASLGWKLMGYRDSFCARLSELAGQNHAEISGGRERLKVQYRPDCGKANDEASLLHLLEESQKEDMRDAARRAPRRNGADARWP